MVIGLFGAPDVVKLHLNVDGKLVEAIEEGNLVRCAHWPALCAGAVIAIDVDDERVVEPAQILEVLYDATDLVVVISRVGREDLDLADEELLLIGAQFVPRLEDVVGPGRQLQILGNQAKPLLVLEDSLTQLLVAIIEKMHGVDLVHPLLRRVVRRVRGPRGILDEERLAGIGLVQPRHPVDGVVRHRGDEVPRSRRLVLEGIDLRRVAEEVRAPLVGIAPHKTIEVLKAHTRRPFVEGAYLARFKSRRVMVLAKPRRCVTVVQKDAPDRGLVLGNNAVVTGEAGRLLRDDAKANRVMIAACDQGRARWRAERGRENPRVAQTLVRNAIHCRCGDHAAKCARHPEARVVRDDQEDVWCLLRRHDARCPPGF